MAKSCADYKRRLAQFHPELQMWCYLHASATASHVSCFSSAVASPRSSAGLRRTSDVRRVPERRGVARGQVSRAVAQSFPRVTQRYVLYNSTQPMSSCSASTILFSLSSIGA